MFLKKKPHLHDVTVMVDMDKNRLVEFLLALVSHQISDSLRFGKHLNHNHDKQRAVNSFACELCMRSWHMSEPSTFIVGENDIV